MLNQYIYIVFFIILIIFIISLCIFLTAQCCIYQSLLYTCMYILFINSAALKLKETTKTSDIHQKWPYPHPWDWNTSLGRNIKQKLNNKNPSYACVGTSSHGTEHPPSRFILILCKSAASLSPFATQNVRVFNITPMEEHWPIALLTVKDLSICRTFVD